MKWMTQFSFRPDYPIQTNAGSIIMIDADDVLKAGDKICDYDPYNNLIVAPGTGRLEYVDIDEGKNLKLEEAPDDSGGRLRRVVNYRNERLRLQIFDKGRLTAEISIPTGALIGFENGATVHKVTSLLR